MRTIAAVSVARSDYGILSPVLRAIQATPDLTLQLVIAGAHLVKDFGDTTTEIDQDGLAAIGRVEIPYRSDTPRAIGEAIGTGVAGFARCYEQLTPDLVLVTGDRYEMLAAAAAALAFTIPIAHLHGGEISEGAIDDQIRHAITKMSHLHFVATPLCAARVEQMGEEPWRITVSGAPALDNLSGLRLLSAGELQDRLGIPFDQPPLLVTYHPVTLEYEQTSAQIQVLLDALREIDRPLVITYPNADTGHLTITAAIRKFASERPAVAVVENLGTAAYFSLMACAAVMVGNSSSGIVEAASFRLPVVNVGNRQRGRERAGNVIDVPVNASAIVAGVRRALSPDFRGALTTLENPYGDGHAAERVVGVLRQVPIDERLRMKRFYAWPRAWPELAAEPIGSLRPR